MLPVHQLPHLGQFFARQAGALPDVAHDNIDDAFRQLRSEATAHTSRGALIRQQQTSVRRPQRLVSLALPLRELISPASARTLVMRVLGAAQSMPVVLPFPVVVILGFALRLP